MNSDFPAPRQREVASPSVLDGTPLQKDRRKDRLIRIAAVKARTGLSTTSIYRKEAEGRFPRRKQLGLRCVAWYESDIDDFVADPLSYRS
ncbi:MAG: AlpA family transcriptional regulator [Sphingobium sp.]|nr:MAG: AlpA family transcriptional regulator [Sphingobium sp.]